MDVVIIYLYLWVFLAVSPPVGPAQRVWVGSRDPGPGGAWLHPDGLVRAQEAFRRQKRGDEPGPSQYAHSADLQVGSRRPPGSLQGQRVSVFARWGASGTSLMMSGN